MLKVVRRVGAVAIIAASLAIGLIAGTAGTGAAASTGACSANQQPYNGETGAFSAVSSGTGGDIEDSFRVIAQWSLAEVVTGNTALGPGSLSGAFTAKVSLSDDQPLTATFRSDCIDFAEVDNGTVRGAFHGVLTGSFGEDGETESISAFATFELTPGAPTQQLLLEIWTVEAPTDGVYSCTPESGDQLVVIVVGAPAGSQTFAPQRVTRGRAADSNCKLPV